MKWLSTVMKWLITVIKWLITSSKLGCCHFGLTTAGITRY